MARAAIIHDVRDFDISTGATPSSSRIYVAPNPCRLRAFNRKRAMLIALLIVVLAVAALLAYASTRPDSFRIERAIHIDAPIVQVAEQIDDFHKWGNWSPWEKIDPTMTRAFSGADAGVGAVYNWDSRGKAGAGRMEITEMRAGAERGLIAIKLEFFKPWKATNAAEFLMTPTEAGTDLSWSMSGPSPFMSKLMGVFMDFDKMVGKDFEAGLAALKRNAEQAPR
jgi:hypothetical protein